MSNAGARLLIELLMEPYGHDLNGGFFTSRGGIRLFNIKDYRFTDAGNPIRLDSGVPGDGAVKLNDPAEKGVVIHLHHL